MSRTVVRLVDGRSVFVSSIQSIGAPGPPGPAGDLTAEGQAALDAAVATATATTSSAASSATASASAAANSETAAGLSAASAAGFATGLFPDTAAGITATTSTSNKYFLVPGAGNTYATLYENVGGTATQLSQIASLTAVQAVTASIENLAPADFAFTILDGSGRATFGLLDDGTMRASNAVIDTLAINETITADEFETASGSLVQGAPSGFVYAFTDQLDHAIGGIRPDGSFEFADITTERINGVAVAALGSGSVSLPTARNYTAEINHVISYGQSLSLTAIPGDIISTVQRFDSLKFSGGTRAELDTASPYTSLVPLVENTSTITAGFGESPLTGATDQVKELILAEDGLAFADHAYQLLATAPGADGQDIAAHMSGTPAFIRFTNAVTNAYTLAQAAGKSYKAQAFFWIQGESDGGTSRASYKSTLITLQSDLQTMAQGITGQSEPLVCISYQTNPDSAALSEIALAQIEAVEASTNIYLSAPIYFLARGDGLHLTATSEKIMGAYQGIAYKRIVIDGLDWKPVVPVTAYRQGSIATVRLNVPRGKLVIDTALFAAKTNFGFTLFTSSDVAIPISSVTITGPDTVKIVASSAIPAGAKLRYGYGTAGVASAGGNIRDEQGDTIIFGGGGINYPMHNWCAVFERILA